MKKRLFPFVTYVILCVLLSSSLCYAAPMYSSKVIDIEEGTTEDGRDSVEKFGTIEDEEDEEEGTDYDEEEDADSEEDKEESDTKEKTEKTSKTTNIFDKSGKDSVDEAMKNNDITIMDDDWELGDDVLPEVDEESFFEHVYNKLWAATTALQKFVCVIAIIFFIMALVMVLVSALGNRAKLPWYLFSALLSAIIFTCSLYAPQIVSAFNNWFVH